MHGRAIIVNAFLTAESAATADAILLAAFFESEDGDNRPASRLVADRPPAGNPPLPCSAGMGTCRIPGRKALADAAAFGHIHVRSLIPGGRCSQGGVKIPTGGKGDVAQARERLLFSREEGSADSVRFRSRRL